jgi:membrane protease YdiL (CAAX protease family)
MWLSQRLWPAFAELTLAFAGLLAGVLATTLVMSGITEVAGSGTPLRLLGGPLITLVAVFVYRRLGEQASRARAVPPEPAASPLAPAACRTTAWVVLAGVAASLLGSFGLGFVLEAIGLPVAEQANVLKIAADARAGEGLGDAAMLVLAALVVAPIAEELLFRDLLWRRVRGVGGAGLAYAISAFGFAIIHANPAGFVIYAWLGVCFAMTLQRTGRIGAAIAVHMGNNAVVLAALFWG